jgi:hypothetical protein
VDGSFTEELHGKRVGVEELLQTSTRRSSFFLVEDSFRESEYGTVQHVRSKWNGMARDLLLETLYGIDRLREPSTAIQIRWFIPQ